MSILLSIREALQKGDASKTIQHVEIALSLGENPLSILNEGLLTAINAVGHKFKENKIFVPEVLLATRAMNAGMEVLKPHLIVIKGTDPCGRILIGTIKGDLHDIGKNLVKVTLEREGYEVKDLGKDVSEDQFVTAYKEFKPHVIGISTLLTSTMGGIRDVINALDEAEIRKNVLVMVGGVPVTERFAMKVGADIYAYDASDAALSVKDKLSMAS